MPLSEYKIKDLLKRFNQSASVRSLWEAQWQEVKELVLCDTTDFNRQTTPGMRRMDSVFDSTAIDACEEFASGLHSYLSSPTERWFELGIAAGAGQKPRSGQDLSDDPEALAWLELVADQIYGVYSDPRAQFNQSLHEVYLDIGAFGTGCLFQNWNEEEGHVLFRSHALAQFYLEEDSSGRIRRLFRKWKYNGDQMREEYGSEPGWKGSKVAEVIEKAGPAAPTKEFTMIHHVCPRSDREYGKLNSSNKAFASYYLCLETSELIKESGFDDFPYAVSRWVKSSEETYGRGPGMKCLPDIKVLQMQERVMLKAGQKAVDPAMVVPDDGFMLPIKTSPGSINFKEAGADPIEFLEFKGDVKFGLEQSNAKREQIRSSFHSDWFKRFHKNREQSATEVNDDRDEMLRFLAPMLGRQQNELLGPTIARTYGILHRKMLIPPSPASLKGKTLACVYISPADRAQQGVKADRIARFMQDIVPLEQVKPGTMDAIDTDAMVQVYANVRGVSRKILRSSKDIAAIRADRAKQQQMQAAAQTAEPASKSVLNLAQASAAGGGGAGAPP